MHAGAVVFLALYFEPCDPNEMNMYTCTCVFMNATPLQ